MLFESAAGWVDLPDHVEPPLEIRINVPPTYAKGPLYHAVILGTGKGYDTLIVSRTKNAKDAVAVIKPGERSPWLTETFTIRTATFTRAVSTSI